MTTKNSTFHFYLSQLKKGEENQAKIYKDFNFIISQIKCLAEGLSIFINEENSFFFSVDNFKKVSLLNKKNDVIFSIYPHKYDPDLFNFECQNDYLINNGVSLTLKEVLNKIQFITKDPLFISYLNDNFSVNHENNCLNFYYQSINKHSQILNVLNKLNNLYIDELIDINNQISDLIFNNDRALLSQYHERVFLFFSSGITVSYENLFQDFQFNFENADYYNDENVKKIIKQSLISLFQKSKEKIVDILDPEEIELIKQEPSRGIYWDLVFELYEQKLQEQKDRCFNILNEASLAIEEVFAIKTEVSLDIDKQKIYLIYNNKAFITLHYKFDEDEIIVDLSDNQEAFHIFSNGEDYKANTSIKVGEIMTSFEFANLFKLYKIK